MTFVKIVGGLLVLALGAFWLTHRHRDGRSVWHNALLPWITLATGVALIISAHSPDAALTFWAVSWLYAGWRASVRYMSNST